MLALVTWPISAAAVFVNDLAWNEPSSVMSHSMNGDSAWFTLTSMMNGVHIAEKRELLSDSLLADAVAPAALATMAARMMHLRMRGIPSPLY
jgi:hypothetical protein